MKIELVICGVLAASGCSKVTYVNRTMMPTGEKSTHTGHYFLAGLVGEKTIRAYEDCPMGLARAQSKFTFGDLLLTGITLGLYAPRTFELECGQ